MSSQLSDKELAELMPSELVQYETPIPTQIVSSDEFYPDPQNERQREVEARLLAMADDLGKKQGLDRRKFFQSAAGMAASFVAMNEVYGPLFDVTKAEAATPAMAEERTNSLKDQFIMDCHTHFLRDDTRIMTFLNMRIAVGKAGWNKSLADKEQTIDDLKYNNYVKEIFLDSDTKIALISSAPSDIEQDWFLTNEMMAQARDKLNKDSASVGNKRLMSHMIFTPGQPDWLDKLDAGLALKPDSARATRSATTRIKTSADILGAWTTRRWPIRATRRWSRLGSRMSASTRAFSRPAWKRSFRGCAASRMWRMSDRRPRIGRSSTSSSITPPIGTSAAIRRWRSRSSSALAASPGPAISPTSRRSMG